MRNKTEYNRAVHDKDNPYMILSLKLAYDSRLSVLDIGIMCKLLSYPPGYIINMTVEQRKSGLGYVVWNTCLRHLKELGYIEKYDVANGTLWVINEIPIDKVKKES
jgi:hypothetical protein